MKTWRTLVAVTALATIVAACSGSESAKKPGGGGKETAAATPSAAGPVSVTSTAFAEGGDVPAKYTCDGADASPPLAWTSLPKGTKDVLVTVTDPDADGFVHWAIWRVDPGTEGLTEGKVPTGARQARNGFGKEGYGGPCPPPGGPHRYVFTVRALSEPLGLDNGADPKDVEEQAAALTLGEGTLTAKFAR